MIDGRLEELVERMFVRCFEDKECAIQALRTDF